MSGFKCGLVGLPNVGKSTLFSALSGVQAEASNYPFCTIEPNIAIVEVPDKRLKEINRLVTTKKVVPAVVEFVDIAGLIRGASKGEGLGNQFLGHIRNVDAIVQVLRCFEGSDIVHVEGKIDPLYDLETVNLELILADLEIVSKRLQNLEKKARVGDKEAQEVIPFVKEILSCLENEKPARSLFPRKSSEAEEQIFRELHLLTAKAQLYVANIGEEDLQKENAHVKSLKEKAKKDQVEVLPISARLEAEINTLEENERQAFLKELNIQERGLNRLRRAGYKILGLETFFTLGPKEIRAWTVTAGSTAVQAAGKIHTDFERGFIRAETFHYQNLIEKKSEKAVKEAGLLRMEGKDYLVKDGDIIRFHFN